MITVIMVTMIRGKRETEREREIGITHKHKMSCTTDGIYKKVKKKPRVQIPIPKKLDSKPLKLSWFSL